MYISESPPKPTVQLYVEQKEVQDQEEVMEWSSVSLRCSAETLCSSPPPTLTWSSTPRNPLSDSSRLQELISDLNFAATRRQHRVTLTCTITYQLQDENKTAQDSISLHVQYAPKISNSSSCTRTDVTLCFCEVDGNPFPELEWHLSRDGLAIWQTGHFPAGPSSAAVADESDDDAGGTESAGEVEEDKKRERVEAQNEAADTHASLQLSTLPSEYETLNIKR
ncbi:hypothetical protein QQF64_035535, partial [Cirrhinus molitorella]